MNRLGAPRPSRSAPRLRSLLFVGLLCAPRVALADVGELALGGIAQAAWPAAGGLGLGLRWGLGDWWAADARLIGGQNDEDWLASGSLGVIFVADVTTWVPELRLAAGGQVAAELTPQITLTAGTRVYLDRLWSLAVEAGGCWSFEQWSALINLVLWRSLD